MPRRTVLAGGQQTTREPGLRNVQAENRRRAHLLQNCERFIREENRRFSLLSCCDTVEAEEHAQRMIALTEGAHNEAFEQICQSSANDTVTLKAKMSALLAWDRQITEDDDTNKSPNERLVASILRDLMELL